MTTQLKVIQPYPSNVLFEAGQLKHVRFAFYKPTAEENVFECVTPYVKCRCYLKDLLYVKFVTKKPMGNVYGFDTAKYKAEDITTDFCRLAVVANKELIDTIEENWHVMIEIEKTNGVIPTEVTRFTDGDLHGMLVVGDPRWQNSLLANSYYTFLFRMLAWKHVECQGADATLQKNAMKLAKKTIDEINSAGFLEKHVPKETMELYNLHNYFGLLFVDTNLKVPYIGTSPYAHLA